MTNKVAILDIQPIDPPIGGGRIRLLGLYGAFDSKLSAKYIGSYDWPGPGERKLQITRSLTEIDIPLDSKHFEANEELNKKIPGKTIIDVTFPLICHLSEDYLERAKNEAGLAQIVVFSHPWTFPAVAPVLNSDKQLIVYDSQNFEGLLRTKLLDDGGYGTYLSKHVIKIEYELCQAADLILACSVEDKNSFIEFYNVDPMKIVLAPNGVFTDKIKPANETEKQRVKMKLNLQGIVAVFIASDYPPNVEAANMLFEMAIDIPSVTFVIIGGVGNSLRDTDRSKNIRITGFVEEDEKLDYLAAADIALNPMISGSGTNIKMFDYMAAGLAVVSTSVGSRGIFDYIGNSFIESDIKRFKATIEDLVNDYERRKLLGNNARKLVSEKFNWDTISRDTGLILTRMYSFKKQNRTPLFSVIVPTYNRHSSLTKLVKQLSLQKVKDFELIIIDQTDENWPDNDLFSELDILYVRSKIKGAVKARNLGAKLAFGEIIAFVDDDCLPNDDWLYNAKKYFLRPNVVGVEGLIASNKIGDPNYRTVSNIGFEGIGFMTANLFVKRESFNKINGFDERFDNPHFREDTDLGWRLLGLGEVPFANDVFVYHPPHRIDIDRESPKERAKFFVQDVLLMDKHPEKYIELMIKESHYINNENFWSYIDLGIRRYGIPNGLKLLIIDKRVNKKYVPQSIIKFVK